ncbi:MAG: glycosyltransferase family 4 protein [Candidatus Bathyarchaeota archaeon]|nr:glycosyltransferase family 4 protein [Candidatus Bathyarchaeota archaeon]
MGKFRLAVFNTQPPHLYFGGVERRITEITKRLSQQADITVYSGTKAGFKQPTVINGVNYVPCRSTDKLFPLDNWSFNRSLSKKTSELHADVYEAHLSSGYGFLKALKKQGSNKPFVHVVHGVLADEYEQAKKNRQQTLRDNLANRFMRRLAKLEEETAKNATLVATISKHSLEKIQKHYQVDTAKVRIIPNGVDPEKFKPTHDPAAAKRQFKLDNKPVVLFVGSLIPRKGLPFLIKAAKKIVKQEASTHFVIVGSGPLKSQLTTSLNEASLLGNFTFLSGLTEEALTAVYNCADVFALPSIQEGQGIVLLEAQATAKPVVAFDVGGVNEAMVNGETGLLVKRGSSDELADALLRLLQDGRLREKMGANGRRFVMDNFTWNVCAERMLAVYREALELTA